MLFGFLLLAAAVADWTPMRWTSADPASLAILKDTPVNCLLLEGAAADNRVVTAASKMGIAALAVVTPAAPEAGVKKAASLKANGVVLEGNFQKEVLDELHKLASSLGLPTIDMAPRAQMRLEPTPVVAATFQGVWPGVQVEEGGSAKAAPSGAPWINTNSGFLRFARALTDAPLWIGVRPPVKTIVTPERYMQAVSDAANVGARWVLALDSDFEGRLLGGDDSAKKDWLRIMELVRYFEPHPEWRTMKPAGQLAIVQDVDSGALLSGGVLDMIAVKHTPVRPVPTHKMQAGTMAGAKMAVNVDPAGLTEEQKLALRAWTRTGGTLLSAPSTWKFPAPKTDQITLSDDDVKVLDEIWKEVNSMTGRTNLGARLFNVSSMLSNLVRSADGHETALQLVNYPGYPVENITVHLLEKFKSARLLAPGAEPMKLDVYDVEEGSGVDIPKMGVAATLLLQ